jgi:hypothetical protein
MAYAPATSTFPTALTTFVRPDATSDTGTFDHAGLESAQCDAIEKLEAEVNDHITDIATIPVKASGAEVTAGSNDAKFVTPKAIADAGITATPVKAAGSDITTGTNDTKFVTAKAMADAGTNLTASSTTVFTNKEIQPRVVSTTDDATAVIDCDVTDIYELTAVANATEFTVTGTPVNGQKLIIRLKDAGVGKGLTWTGFTAIGVTLPTTTVAGKKHYIGCIYNANATATWDVVAVVAQA